MRCAIVVVAYNRTHSLKRLLTSLSDAQYTGFKDIPLIISVDNSGDVSPAAVADEFIWEHGDKRVIRHRERQGLKNHILKCGDLSREYGSIIMLEDDLYVSPFYYGYASKALDFTASDSKVAGISLYAHRFNVFARLPFEPIYDGYSNWYFQFASSWGQAWTSGQWEAFREWLKINGDSSIEGSSLPKDIERWGERSWLKYADKYLKDEDKYFFYPRVSYTTNFADQGEHAAASVTDLQVPLAEGEDICRFSGLSDSKAVYDPYFENQRLEQEADLYGLKSRDGNISGRYVYSTTALGYKVMCSYGLLLKPMEANIIHNIDGNDIFLYDTQSPDIAPRTETGRIESYFYPGINRQKIFRLAKRRLSGK